VISVDATEETAKSGRASERGKKREEREREKETEAAREKR